MIADAPTISISSALTIVAVRAKAAAMSKPDCLGQSPVVREVVEGSMSDRFNSFSGPFSSVFWPLFQKSTANLDKEIGNPVELPQ